MYRQPTNHDGWITSFGQIYMGLSTKISIVSPDALRLCYTGRRWWGPIEHEVWATTRTMIRALFWAENKTVILDSTGLNRKHRDMFTPSPDVDWRRYVMIVDTDVDLCKKRALETGQDYLLDVIDWFHKTQEKIHPDENIGCGAQ